MPLKTTYRSSSSQRGAVLTVSLLLLLIMTILGITALSSSTLEEKMSANKMNQHITFHAAESAHEGVLNNLNSLATAINTGGPETVNIDLNEPSVTSTAVINYLGQGLPEGFSLGENKGSFIAHRFDVQGTGTKASASAQTTTTQGLFIIGPGGS